MSKHFLLPVALIALLVNTAISQVATDPRTEEYATVRAVISLQTGGFSTLTTLPNPFLEMETASMELRDFISSSKGVKFETITQMINYMNKFSWQLLFVTSSELKDPKSPEVMNFYTFKRKPKTK
jgi:hypothetical protein